MRTVEGQTYYDAIEVEPEATLQEIERAYRIARATYQPDSVATYSVFSDRDNSEILRRIEEAYLVLSDARMRREYDARLRRESSGERAPARVAAPAREPAPRPPRPEPASSADIRAGEVPRVVSAPPASSARQLSLEPVLGDSLEPQDGIYDGTALRRIRLSRGVELEEISGVTKINELYLRCLEENRYRDLPAPVYVRGWVKEYARCLHLDARQVASSYMERFQSRREPEGRRA